MKKEPMAIFTTRLPVGMKSYLKSLPNPQQHIRECIILGSPDMLNPPVIEIMEAHIGFYAFEDGYDGANDDCLVTWGRTKEAAKEDYLSQWREQQ
jgi:hypothetical protein